MGINKKKDRRQEGDPMASSTEDDLTQYITYPIWKKMRAIATSIEKLQIRQKRIIFNVIRNSPDGSHDTFFPSLGITAGCFCTWQILGAPTTTTS